MGWWRRWLVCAAYTVLLTVLSLVPRAAVVPVSPPIPHADKLGHFLAYGLYALLIAWAAAPRWRIDVRSAAAVVIYCGLFGLCMEVLQPVMQPMDRTFSMADFLANIAGSCVFVGIACVALPDEREALRDAGTGRPREKS